jgi:hypothetical protein
MGGTKTSKVEDATRDKLDEKGKKSNKKAEKRKDR